MELPMATHAELRDLADRPRRYWNVDGIPELMMGLVWIIWGGALILGESIPRGSFFGLYWLVVPAVLVLSGFASNWAVRKLKERLTYPRTGYIEYHDPGGRVRILTALVAIVSAAVMAALLITARAAGAEHTAAPAIGVILSLALLVASVRQRAPHFLALAGVALTLGLAFAALRLGWAAVPWMFLWLGLAATILGAWRLRRYVRLHPAEAR
jgi:hypothetical protein